MQILNFEKKKKKKKKNLSKDKALRSAYNIASVTYKYM